MKVVIARAEDWEGLYIDGVLRREGHSLSVEDVLREVGVDVQFVRPNQSWLENSGSLPEHLVDVKMEAMRCP